MMLRNLDDLKEALHDMVQGCEPDEKAPVEKQVVLRHFQCIDPNARSARAMHEASNELAKMVIFAATIAEEIKAYRIQPCDIYEIGIGLVFHDPDPEDEEAEPYWTTMVRVDFRPTNGWEPGGPKT